MKNIFFYTLLTIIVTVAPSKSARSKDVNNNAEIFKYRCNLEKKHCVKIINKKRESCYSSQNGLMTKVPCSSDKDCMNTIECTTLSNDLQTHKSFIKDRSRVSVGPTKTTTPSPLIVIDINMKGINKVDKTTRYLDKPYSYANGPLGPTHWPDNCLNSAEKRQSPINIITQGSLRMASLSPLKINYYNHKTLYSSVYLENYRNYLRIYLSHDIGITLEGGGLENPNLLFDIRFHFGCTSDRGSEHQINSKKYPLEIQFLFLELGSVDQNYIAVLFEEGDLQDNNIKTFDIFDKAINKMGYNIDGVVKITDDVELLLGGLLPNDINIGLRSFYKYRGSLTTPPCSNANWFVIADSKLKVPAKFLQTLRKLRSGMDRSNNQNNLMCDNFRPIQKNEEKVYWYQNNRN